MHLFKIYDWYELYFSAEDTVLRQNMRRSTWLQTVIFFTPSTHSWEYTGIYCNLLKFCWSTQTVLMCLVLLLLMLLLLLLLFCFLFLRNPMLFHWWNIQLPSYFWFQTVCKLCLVNTFRHITEVPQAVLEVAQIHLKHYLVYVGQILKPLLQGEYFPKLIAFQSESQRHGFGGWKLNGLFDEVTYSKQESQAAFSTSHCTDSATHLHAPFIMEQTWQEMQNWALIQADI